jgi:hypothetical protein
MAQRKGDADPNEDNVHTPMLQHRLHVPRSVFTPGHRIRMNVVPMFLNIFIPWLVFVLTLAICSFKMMYSRKPLAYVFLVLLVGIWIVSVLVARDKRKNDPEPAWFTYFSIMMGLGLFFGFFLGIDIFHNWSFNYYTIKDLKVIGHLDASKERGQNVMDAGIVYFAEGNGIDAERSWHFKQGDVYCVAPIIAGQHPAVPDTQSFDFWAVGKNCCSVSASDFRCGDFENPLSRSAIRAISPEDTPYYRLAVEQAETLYGIMATHPVFFEWAQDPLDKSNLWIQRSFTHFVMYVTMGFVISMLGVSCASCNFAWIGRSETVYGEDVVGDSDYKMGGPANRNNFRYDA